MNEAGSKSGLRLVVQVSALVAAGSLGFLLAAHPPTAAAEGLLPTTVAIRSLPVTLPTVSLPNLTSTGTSDANGYLVRGAKVTIRSVPNGLLDRAASKRSAGDGRATFVIRAKEKGLRAGSRLWLLVTATDPARPKTIYASRTVAIPIKARNH